MKLKDITMSSLGLITGKDAIKIERIENIGSVNKSLCSADINAEFIPVSFIFDGVILFNFKSDGIRGVLSDDEFDMYSESESESVIEEIENSKIVNLNKGLNRYDNFKHIIMSAYDYNVEVVCNSVELEVNA